MGSDYDEGLRPILRWRDPSGSQKIAEGSDIWRVRISSHKVMCIAKIAQFSLQRGPDGKFNDDDLANILHNATENAANTYGAQSTPAALRVIEIMGLQQARQWGVCTMNEFRQFLGLKRMFSAYLPPF